MKKKIPGYYGPLPSHPPLPCHPAAKYGGAVGHPPSNKIETQRSARVGGLPHQMRRFSRELKTEEGEKIVGINEAKYEMKHFYKKISIGIF